MVSDRTADVVIAGAGPVGLMLAVELLSAKADVVLVERLLDIDRRLRAPGLTGRSIEALDRRGLLSPLMDAVAEVEPAYQAKRGPSGKAPDILALRAGLLEEILRARVLELGGELHYGVEVTAIVPGESEVAVKTKKSVEPSGATAPGTSCDFTAAYVVGCDGGRSTVRKAAGIRFPGGGVQLVGYQAVVEVEPHGALERTWQRTPNGICAYALGPSRVVSVEFGREPMDRQTRTTLDEVEASLYRTSGKDVKLVNPVSLTRFTGSCRLAESYRRGRVLLAGDAAHIHPPFGGQGLNLGLQDAVNLGWKLAAEVRGQAPNGLLSTYETERRPVAARVLRNAEAATRLLDPSPHNDAPHGFFFTELMRDPAVKKRMHDVFATRQIKYDIGPPDAHDLMGRAVSDVSLFGPLPRRLSQLMRHGKPILLSCSSVMDLGELTADYREAVATAVLREPLDGMVSALIRPDGYVAWCAADRAEMEGDGLRVALEQWVPRPH